MVLNNPEQTRAIMSDLSNSEKSSWRFDTGSISHLGLLSINWCFQRKGPPQIVTRGFGLGRPFNKKLKRDTRTNIHNNLHYAIYTYILWILYILYVKRKLLFSTKESKLTTCRIIFLWKAILRRRGCRSLNFHLQF